MSFISVEPQSRVVLESHSNSLLSQFDTHLRIIADRYLAFFLERRSIETTYINSLRGLYRKATTVDASFDARSEPTNTRAAWDRVRDSLESEARAQQTFVDILDRDVIEPLRILRKETKDVIRSRVKDDLKESAMKYADHAENTISKLQEAYLKKYHPLEYSHSIKVSQPREDVRNKKFGGKVSALFRGPREPELVEPEVTDYACREAVRKLNYLRSMRAEYLGDGYGCLEALIFTPTIKDVLVKYMDGMITAHAKYDDPSKSATAGVKKALAGTDTSDLKASFRQALSFSIPPLTLYRDYRPGAYSKLIFGVPLVEVTIDEDNVPKVIRMCIEEVENRGLDTKEIYPLGRTGAVGVLELRRRFESEKSFSFSPTDNIRFIAELFTCYIWDIPEPLLVLSLEEYRQYTQYRDDFSLLRSKLRELHPVHRASLRALLRHFSRVASHWDKNGMTIKALTDRFSYAILQGNQIFQDGFHVKTLVMEDLIRNVHTLFDEYPSQPPPVSSPDVAESTSAHTYGSLFLSPEIPQRTEIPTMGSTSTTQGLVDGISTSIQSSSASLPLSATIDSRLTPSPTRLLSPLLGLPSSNTLTEGGETTSKEEVISAVGGAKAVETLASRGVVSVPPTSVAEWRLRQSQLPPQPETLTILQSPPESVLLSMSDFPFSSATSLQTGMGGF